MLVSLSVVFSQAALISPIALFLNGRGKSGKEP